MKRRRSPALRIITVVLLITVGIFFLLGNLEDRPVSNTASLTRRKFSRRGYADTENSGSSFR